MHSHQEIIEKYSRADVEQRLSLFLDCPPLRDAFLSIDQGEAQLLKEGRIKPKKSYRRGWFSFY